jgi:pimeloyl-ACP methyl ester carboxylesterase
MSLEGPYRRMGGRQIVEIALSTTDGYTPSDEIREDYMAYDQDDRFADTIPYAQSYREQLPLLADLLPSIVTPVRIVQGSDDQVVPPINAEFRNHRLLHSRVDFIAGAGHFCWEAKPMVGRNHRASMTSSPRLLTSGGRLSPDG